MRSAVLSRFVRFICSFALCFALGLLCLAYAAPARAQAAQFDLQGPTLEVKVQRAGKTLPIAEVPNLQEGDRLWLHPVLGNHESVHYLMVAAFLRGSTNPPPDNWFHKVEAWNKQVMEEGVYLPVPPGAEQVVVLFAPQTGGDFSALKSAVRGRPGAFVRASQDLRLASLDRERINTYLQALRAIQDPDKIKPESNTLARSLSLKLNQDCFQRPADQQASCLQQSQSALILDNGSINPTQGLLSGPTSDLAFQAGATSRASAASLYDPYISAAFDIAKILATFHTAQYQYIPALSDSSGVDMNLWLNAPPSFHNPKSVLVVALPPVEKARLPELRPVDPKRVYCMQQSPLTLPVDGSPAIFATGYAHGLTLHLSGANGKTLDVPTQADPAAGGFAVPATQLESAHLGNEMNATVQGSWGFDAYTGPSFQLRSTAGAAWTVAGADKNALVVGRDDELHLHSEAAACVESVSFRDAGGEERAAAWKLDGADGILATLPLKNAQPGPLLLLIKQYGLAEPKTLSVPAFAEAGKYEAFTIHAGDGGGVLTGSRLDEVARLDLQGETLVPGTLTRKGDKDSLQMAAGAKSNATAAGSGGAKGQVAALPVAVSSKVAGLTEGTRALAQITLKDGRTVAVPVTVEASRPSIALINKEVELPPPPSTTPGVTLKLGGPDELPLDGKLTFAVKTQTPAAFARNESVEIATVDGLFSTTLSLRSGQLILQDAKTAIGTLDPAKSFGPSAFGPLRLRPVMVDGTAGDWVPLATLVRLPGFVSYTCPPEGAGECTLAGNNLFLLASIATDPQFTKAVTVPDGFAANTLEVPRTAAGQLFAKLRDDPSVVNTLSIPAPAARAAGRRPRRLSTGEDSPSSRDPASGN